MKDNSALLVVDMQNVYLPENEWACKRMKEIIKYIEKEIKNFKSNQIFFTQHRPAQKPKGAWKMYNEKYIDINSNEYLNDYVPELKKYITKDNLYTKTGFSALSNKALIEELDKFDTIYITGVVAECCILSTIFGLIDMGKKIMYCCGGIAGQNEEKEKAVKEVLKGESPLHVEFID